jgi:hypothetical protein
LGIEGGGIIFKDGEQDPWIIGGIENLGFTFVQFFHVFC